MQEIYQYINDNNTSLISQRMKRNYLLVCIFEIIDNKKLVCFESVRSSILN